MSYILDALRRADSERERGLVPSIHSPPAPQVLDDPKPQRDHAKPLVWVIVALLLALAGLLAWHFFSGKAPAGVVAEPAPVQVVEPVAQEVSPPVAAPTPAPLVQRPSPVLRAQVPLGAAPILSVPPKPAPATPAKPTKQPPADLEADPRVYTTNDLPPDIQRDLPKLVVGGAMYSETPANRLLIINGQVFHEGDKLAPDLVLQEVKLKSAVFKYKGYRYGVSY